MHHQYGLFSAQFTCCWSTQPARSSVIPRKLSCLMFFWIPSLVSKRFLIRCLMVGSVRTSLSRIASCDFSPFGRPHRICPQYQLHPVCDSRNSAFLAFRFAIRIEMVRARLPTLIAKRLKHIQKGGSFSSAGFISFGRSSFCGEGAGNGCLGAGRRNLILMASTCRP